MKVTSSTLKVLLLEPFSGMSGDMLLGAVVALGVPVEFLHEQVRALGLEDRVDLRVSTIQRGGIEGTKVDVLVDGHPETPGGEGHAGHKHETGVEEIFERIRTSSLESGVRERAEQVFGRLAEAEAKVHGGSPGSVHLHEAGAIDAVVDVVCGVAAVRYLEVDRVVSTPPCDGHGEVVTSHGILPVPAPATAILLEGVPVQRVDVPFELLTPTGAALLVSLAGSFLTEFTMEPERVGYGAGTREIPGRPNLLRATVGEMIEGEGVERDRVMVLETAVDDAVPEIWEHLIERLLGEGARDAWLTPIVMKKGRPGVHVTVLSEPDRVPLLERILFEETGTLGMRVTSAGRRILPRTTGILSTDLGPLKVKLSRMPGSNRWRVHPEYEACRAAAQEHGLPLRDVYAEVSRAAAGEDALTVEGEEK